MRILLIGLTTIVIAFLALTLRLAKDATAASAVGHAQITTNRNVAPQPADPYASPDNIGLF